jgi:hypothetical protein
MVIEFIQKYVDTMIKNNQSWNATDLENTLFREGYNVVFCVPHTSGSKFRIHLGNQEFIEGILTSSGTILI